MGISKVIPDRFVKENERLLSDGIWCIVQLSYEYDEDAGGAFVINEITPIQMPGFNLQEIIDARKQFTKEEWIDMIAPHATEVTDEDLEDSSYVNWFNGLEIIYDERTNNA